MPLHFPFVTANRLTFPPPTHTHPSPPPAPPWQALVGRLVADPDLAAACPAPFDEGLLWRHDSADRHAVLREQLQEAFHNITRLMDCVGCEKCKMHGKLNILGIATAMKVLFAQPDEGGCAGGRGCGCAGGGCRG